MQEDRRRIAWWAPALVMTLVAGVMWYGLGTGVLPRMMAAIALLSDMSGGSGDNTGPADVAAPAPQRVPIGYTVEGRRRSGDLYEPNEPVAGALVLVPGVVVAGKDDPRLVAFARTLARAHFRVLVPEVPGLRNLQIDPADSAIIADAVAWLAQREGGGRQVGLVALSYAAGPALLAALDRRVCRQVGFVLSIGGYHSSVETITFITTGRFRDRPGAPWREGNPYPYGKWVFVRSNAALLDDPAEQAALRAIADRRLADFTADTTDLEMRLGPQGRAVLALLDNRDPDRVPELIAALPPGVQRSIAALDLSRQDLSHLRARLILIHGRDDSIIPYTESESLAAAVPPGRSDLHIIGNLSHVELGPGGLRDTLALWQAIYDVLEARDRS